MVNQVVTDKNTTNKIGAREVPPLPYIILVVRVWLKFTSSTVI